eukprot:TRINITY_DN78665_c0_g1_i1.p1 TRINITY_DN78665_c0_g1~~TRINITY_DN78665_c0_g1_i1.p1  ORF type:complete len:288 (-),score=46.57 TRINITY_DN78665_c0_g1_i1:124-987(-)
MSQNLRMDEPLDGQLTIFKFNFSPPARLVHLVSEISRTGASYQEVLLYNLEHMNIDFLKVNPKHQVPAMKVNGKFMSESRDICRYLLDEYKAADHWYPKDSQQREEVDKWLDWSKPLHLGVEFGVVASHVGPQARFHWRKTMGCMMALARKKFANSGVQYDLRMCIEEAETILSGRKIEKVEDLNLGDLATFMEVSLPMECHPNFSWVDYPNLNNLYKVMKMIPEFSTVHEPFLDFTADFRRVRDSNPSYALYEYPAQCCLSVRTICKVCRMLCFVNCCRDRSNDMN